MVTLILFVLIFGVVVVSHEFGHFLLAKANGIHVIEFSVGMGPNLFSFQKGDPNWIGSFMSGVPSCAITAPSTYCTAE